VTSILKWFQVIAHVAHVCFWALKNELETLCTFIFWPKQWLARNTRISSHVFELSFTVYLKKPFGIHEFLYCTKTSRDDEKHLLSYRRDCEPCPYSKLFDFLEQVELEASPYADVVSLGTDTRGRKRNDKVLCFVAFLLLQWLRFLQGFALTNNICVKVFVIRWKSQTLID